MDGRTDIYLRLRRHCSCCCGTLSRHAPGRSPTCCVMVCYDMLCHITLHYTVLHIVTHVVLCCIVLYSRPRQMLSSRTSNKTAHLCRYRTPWEEEPEHRLGVAPRFHCPTCVFSRRRFTTCSKAGLQAGKELRGQGVAEVLYQGHRTQQETKEEVAEILLSKASSRSLLFLLLVVLPLLLLLLLLVVVVVVVSLAGKVLLFLCFLLCTPALAVLAKIERGAGLVKTSKSENH